MDKYPISTSELVSIAVKEIAKDIPVLGSIISTDEAVFSKIEAHRVDQVLKEIMARILALEGDQANIQEKLNKAKGYAALIYGCDQARSDVLCESKAHDYGYVIGNLIHIEAEMNDVVEILDSLRKLSSNDLKCLYKFKIDGRFFESRAVSELAEYQFHIRPILDERHVARIKENMQIAYPTLMRLQGLGVLFLEKNPSGGAAVPIGGLSEHLNSFATLTPIGAKLVQALP